MEEVIEEFEHLKDLGVHMNNMATFDTNVTNVIKKSRQKLGWIMRSFHSRNMMFMKQMFKTPFYFDLKITSNLNTRGIADNSYSF